VCRTSRAGLKEWLGTLPGLVVSGGYDGDRPVSEVWRRCSGHPCPHLWLNAGSTHAAWWRRPSSSSVLLYLQGLLRGLLLYVFIITYSLRVLECIHAGVNHCKAVSVAEIKIAKALTPYNIRLLELAGLMLYRVNVICMCAKIGGSFASFLVRQLPGGIDAFATYQVSDILDPDHSPTPAAHINLFHVLVALLLTPASAKHNKALRILQGYDSAYGACATDGLAGLHPINKASASSTSPTPCGSKPSCAPKSRKMMKMSTTGSCDSRR